MISCPVQDVLTTSLERAGYSIDYDPEISYTELQSCIESYDILIISTSIPIDKDLLERAKSLKAIGRLGSGLDHIDLDYARQKGIEIISTPESNSRAVAEHVLSMLLSYNTHLCRAQREVKDGVWLRSPNTGTELLHKKIGIIGFGHNGSLTARLLSSIGMEVKVYDPYVDIQTTEKIQIAESLEELLSDIDYLSFHVPLSSETHYYFDKSLIDLTQRPFVLVNISRGEVVNTQDLIEGLEAEKIQAALLDVIEDEKKQIQNEVWIPKDEVQQELKSHPRVFISPHIAGYSFEAKYAMNKILADKLLKFLRGF